MEPVSFQEGNEPLPKVFKAYGRMSWRQRMVGDFDYRRYCTPVLMGREKSADSAAPFFAKDEPTPLLLALFMGLQHAMTVMGGVVLLITITTFGAPLNIRQYLISSALIVSGIVSVLQVCAIPIPFTKGKMQIGTGLLSLVGTSPAYLALFIALIRGQMLTVPDITWVEAYGGVVGALMVSSLVGLVLALIPTRMLRSMLPPVVVGATLMLIGTSLADTALKTWAGGELCGRYVSVPGCGVLNPVTGEYVPSSNCFMAPGTYPCIGNGEVTLPFGAPQYIGLGLFGIVVLVVIELFGSPFFKGVPGITALLAGLAFAACFTYEGARYVSMAPVAASPWFTFLWMEYIPLSFYLPALLPGIVISVVDLMDTIGDVAGSSTVSRVVPEGPEHVKRIKGALLSDFLATIFSGLTGGVPVTTYSLNNGIISMTRCASRIAGLFACMWLVIFGVVAKIGAFFASIPNCVLGGVSAYVIGTVIVSGLGILSMETDTRRNRTILAMSLVLGVGVEMVPQFFVNLWVVDPSQGFILVGLANGVIATLQNGVSLGAVAGLLLHAVLPNSSPEELAEAVSLGEQLRTMSGTLAEAMKSRQKSSSLKGKDKHGQQASSCDSHSDDGSSERVAV